MILYADTEDKWAKVAKRLFETKLCGLDTETYGHNVRETTAPYRAKVHIWSVAVVRADGEVRGVVLPCAALAFGPIRAALEDPGIVKVAHNAPHDVHALANGCEHFKPIVCQGWVDSLPRARLYWPAEEGHGLKRLCAKVGMALTEYKEVLTAPNWVDGMRKQRVCECGNLECEASARLKGHKRQVIEYPERILKGSMIVPLENVGPGHALWLKLLEYAGEDAVAALKLWLLMDSMQPPESPNAPWLVEMA